MVVVKKWPFFRVLFFRQYRPGKCFYNILERKNAFLALKKKDVQKVEKNKIFPKGLTHGFGEKMAIFPCVFLSNIGQENVFYNILEQKNACLAYKNNTFKKSKN